MNYYFLNNRYFKGLIVALIFFTVKLSNAQFENVDLGARAVETIGIRGSIKCIYAPRFLALHGHTQR